MKTKKYYILLMLFCILVVCIVAFNPSIKGDTSSQIEYTERGNKVVFSDGVYVFAKQVEHCAWKPDGQNDGYKVCEAIIYVENPNNYTLIVDKPGIGYTTYFNLDKTNIVKGSNYQYYFSNQYENITKLDPDTNIYYTEKKYFNWQLLAKDVKDTPTHNYTHFAYKVGFEFPQYEAAVYNFSINFKKNSGESIPVLLDPDISGCGSLNTAGATYTLTQDITSGAGFWCMSIDAGNITFNLNGFTLNATDSLLGSQIQGFYGDFNLSNGTIGGNIGNALSLSDSNTLTNITVITNNTNSVGIVDSNNYDDNITLNIINSNLTGYSALYGIGYDTTSSSNIINITLKNTTILGFNSALSVSDNLFLYGQMHATISDSNLTGVTYALNMSDNNSIVYVINSNSSPNFIDTNALLYKQWYLDLSTNYTHNGTLVNSANVTFYNSTNNFQFSFLTNSSGDINQTVITEYSQKGTTPTYYSNYTVNISKTGFDILSAKVNVTGNTILSYSLNDSIPPTINIVHPEPITYSTNASLSLNYTVSDLGVGVESCWYKVINSTNDLIIDNTTLASCANSTFSLPSGDTDYVLIVFSNDTNNNLATSNVSFGLRTEVPSVVLNYPINGLWLQNTSVYFNYTATSGIGLDTCELYENTSGSWTKNYTWVAPTNGVMNYTILNVSDGYYKWNIWCNDTTDKNSTALNNYTFGVDTIYPTGGNLSINTTASSQKINFSNSVSDTNLDRCLYSIVDYTGAVDGTNQNITFQCNNVTTATVSSFATYTLYIIAYDLANNSITQNLSFTTSATVSLSILGGGSTPLTNVAEDATWKMTAEDGSGSYQFRMSRGATRTKAMVFENLGDKEVTLTLACEDDEFCNYVLFEKDELTLPVGLEIPYYVNFYVKLPQNVEIGDYIMNIKASNKNDAYAIPTILTVRVTVSQANIFIDLINKLGQSRYVGQIPISYGAIFLIILIFGTTLITVILRRLKIKYDVLIGFLTSGILGFIIIYFI